MKRSAEIEKLVERWFEAASSGDASLVDELVSREQGSRLIGSDPAEVLKGGEAIASFLRGEVSNSGGQAKFTPDSTEAFEEGTVGWASTQLTITLPDGGHISPRWTAVFHREGDSWKFVQTHASIGIPNQDIGWTYTPETVGGDDQ